MRILIDTNVLISAILFPDSLPYRVVEKVIIEHTLILSPGIIEEIKAVFSRKFLTKLPELERFFTHLAYELPPEVTAMPHPLLHVIRDENDVHVLAAALAANADILLTGDQDFAELPMTKPLVLTPRQFIDKFA